jgi:hypothetical protein
MLNVFVREDNLAASFAASRMPPREIACCPWAYPEHFRYLFQPMKLRQRQ